jgi:hypothetical protein
MLQQISRFAMREVMQSSDYSTGASAYQDKDPVDIMVRGTMLVKVNSGTPHLMEKFILEWQTEQVTNQLED